MFKSTTNQSMALSIGELFIQLDFIVYRSHFMCNNHHKLLLISLPFSDQQNILLPLTYLLPIFSQPWTSPSCQVMWTSCTQWRQSEHIFLPNSIVNGLLCAMVLAWHSGVGKFERLLWVVFCEISMVRAFIFSVVLLMMHLYWWIPFLVTWYCVFVTSPV